MIPKVYEFALHHVLLEQLYMICELLLKLIMVVSMEVLSIFASGYEDVQGNLCTHLSCS